MAKKKVVPKSASKSKRKKSAKKPNVSKAKSKAKSNVKPRSRVAKAPARKSAKQSSAAARRSSVSAGKVQLRSANLSREFYQGKVELEDGDPIEPRGIGSEAAGQSGDLQGLSEIEETESESVEELVEEGQDYEAEVVAGLERAADAPDAGVPIRERKTEFDPEDSVSATPARRGRRRSG